MVTLATTGIAIAIRLYLLSRLRYLSGITEYDDGVYLGGAVSLVSGDVPYHGFAFVQPPGILLMMAPVALFAKISSAASAMAAARLLTVAASAACVPLVGMLVRHRGTLVTLVACGLLAVYPDDIMAAHTLLLEPWMNLLALGGANLAFDRGRLATPGRLRWAGAMFGLAGAVKYWAALPALTLLAALLLAACPSLAYLSTGRLSTRRPATGRTGRLGTGRLSTGCPCTGRGRRGNLAVGFASGVLAGFAVPVLPFAAPWPGLFVRSTLLDQVARVGSAVPESLRLTHLTGLADVLNDAGRLSVSGNEGSLFARGDVTAAATWATGWLPVLLAFVLAALIGVGYTVGLARQTRVRCTKDGSRDSANDGGDDDTPAAAAPDVGDGPRPLEWWAVATLACTVAAVLGYSAFFYHYADFTAPWLAISAGYATGALCSQRAATPRGAATPREAMPPRRTMAREAMAPREATPPRRTMAREAMPPPAAMPPRGTTVPPGPQRALVVAAAAFVALAGFQAWELSGLRAPDVRADATLIRPGACVVSDEISLAIAANRFTAGSAGCPDVLDSLATTLVAGNGLSVEGGAKALPRVTTDWEGIFARADYVWLSGSSGRRIPWTADLHAWFARNFRPLNPPRGEVSEGTVYIRRAPVHVTHRGHGGQDDHGGPQRPQGRQGRQGR